MGDMCLSCFMPGYQNDQEHSGSSTFNLAHKAIIKGVINNHQIYRKAKLMS